MKVLITGGTGFIGAHSAVAAEQAGHEVRLLVRDLAKAQRIARAVGLVRRDFAMGDISDAGSVERALRGCRAVLHTAAMVTLDRRRAADALRTSADGARNVLRAAAELGFVRIIHVSSTSALNHTAAAPIAVTAPVATAGTYAAAKVVAEEVARDLQQQGAPVHITYPGGVIGPAAGESLGEASNAIARFVAAGVLPTQHASLSLLDVRDLARIHRALLEPGQRPGRVMCGGSHMTMEEFGSALRAVTGRRFRTLPVPPAVLRAAGRLADGVGARVRVQFPITEESMSLITTWPGTLDNAPSELAIDYRPIGDTLADAIAAWLRAGLITRRQAGHVSTLETPLEVQPCP